MSTDHVFRASIPAQQHCPGRPRVWPRRLRRTTTVVFVATIALTLAAGSSRVQAAFVSRVGEQLYFWVGPGRSPSIRFPDQGPYDARLGYKGLDELTERLAARGFEVAEQARLSPDLARLTDWGLSPPYREKSRAGLQIHDQRERSLYLALHPTSGYADFEAIPALVVRTLLFIENRELLAPGSPYRNPAIEWDRFLGAIVARTWDLGRGRRTPGGSTLATQLEKYRHSPSGRTASISEKLRQMASASVRAYSEGPVTLDARRRIVVDYLNTVPLAARPGFGDVAGLGDGLMVWYGTDLRSANALLSSGGRTDVRERGRIYLQVLSLLVAQRRPSDYLLRDRVALQAKTRTYLQLLFEAGVVDVELRDAAMTAPLAFRPSPVSQPRSASPKAVDAVRVELLDLLGTRDLYDLDRLDLNAVTTLNGEVQSEAVALLQRLRDAHYVTAEGLRSRHLLERGDPRNVVYSLLLFERTPNGNAVRLEVDTLDQPFNVNQGGKQELGSTAKLRVLVLYLELVAELHDKYSQLSHGDLEALKTHRSDQLTQWLRATLLANPSLSLSELLNLALERTYSADPHTRFFTGGGMHRFHNFDRKDDARVLSLREAFRHSVNVPFIRLMREIVRHVLSGPSGFTSGIIENENHPLRRKLLERFAEYESRRLLQRYRKQVRDLGPDESLARLVARGRPTLQRVAAIFRSIAPEEDVHSLRAFLDEKVAGHGVDQGRIRQMYATLSPTRLSLSERARMAGVHPIELWLTGYLRKHPDAKREELLRASATPRNQAYEWLFRTRRKRVQDLRIRTILEQDAFAVIHSRWARLGYPFASLVPSLATAIGASADRPAALAELLGIILSDGVRLPVSRIEKLRFAEGTPYETNLRRLPRRGEQVLRPEVARIVRRALIDVVERGTARRVRGAFQSEAGAAVPVGGKTGTGDNRAKSFDADGKLVESKVVSRTATLAFVLGERHSGVISAYVEGPRAADYAFTSSLPSHVLKLLGPVLSPLLSEESAVRATAYAGGEG